MWIKALIIVYCAALTWASESSCTQGGTTWYSEDRCILNIQGQNGQITQYKRQCPTIPYCKPQKIQIRDCCPFCAKADVLNVTENTYGYSDYKDHSCMRKCVSGKSMTCKYTFTVSEIETSSTACFNCPYKKSDCYRKNCISADGVSRLAISTNKLIPGPGIQVCVGDTVVVDIRNKLLSQTLTMHWHGIPQRDTQYFDGVPYITQCPIVYSDAFRYVFNADDWGTYFYHPHTGAQITDGCAGPIIIRQPDSENALRHLYDEDCYKHLILIQDWTYTIAEVAFTRQYYNDDPMLPDSILINGKGRMLTESTVPLETTANNSETAQRKLAKMPFTEFIVERGKRYRFRIINAGSFICPLAVSIDNHTLTIIATDGYDVEPTPVDSIITNDAERFDVIIDANQNVDKYWIRVNAIQFCHDKLLHQLAILRYKGSSDGEPNQSMGYVKPEGVRLGNIPADVTKPEDLKVSDLRSLAPLDEGVNTADPDYKFYVQLAENSVPFSFLTPYPDIPPVPAFQINHISLDLPSESLLTQPFDPATTLCNETSLENRNCTTELCLCVYVLQVKLNSIVEVIMFYTGSEAASPDHPMHFHGYTYRVVAMERAYNITKEKLQQMDTNGEINRNFNMPTAKDTVVVYNPGYTIFRFNASNPGIWLLHCHQQFHLTQGMGLFIQVGEKSDLPPVPPNLPTCGNYQPS